MNTQQSHNPVIILIRYTNEISFLFFDCYKNVSTKELGPNLTVNFNIDFRSPLLFILPHAMIQWSAALLLSNLPTGGAKHTAC